ncbi:MAG: ABC-F family ATP-binding cassette domain-containing protein [Hyphomicrobiales bacterium]|nr:ABC-F family ATP-binding cassette domain-containing protein [Hyphomicrobiales bacterium]
MARFPFRADAAQRTDGTLSGGEMQRAALAIALGGSTPPRLLILDEPTNHLDLDSSTAIEAALCGYDGALLVASHDRNFLDAIGITRQLDLPLTRDEPLSPSGADEPPVRRDRGRTRHVATCLGRPRDGRAVSGSRLRRCRKVRTHYPSTSDDGLEPSVDFRVVS